MTFWWYNTWGQARPAQYMKTDNMSLSEEVTHMGPISKMPKLYAAG